MVRGQPRETAILQAALELLAELGYERLTTDAVALRAQASKATIYRRWRNKAELVAAALDALDAHSNRAVPDTGSLRSDLVAVMRGLRDKATASYIAMMQDLVLSARRDPQLSTALRAHIDNDELSPFQKTLRRAVARKSLPASAPIELVHDVAEALIQRQLQRELTFDERFITRVVDQVLMPLLQQQRRRA